MNAPLPRPLSKDAAFFRTSRVPETRMPRSVAMPAWRSQKSSDIECVVIVIGSPRRATFRPDSQQRVRCLHAYGTRGASPLCGASDWQELVPPTKATCPACHARLGRPSLYRVH